MAVLAAADGAKTVATPSSFSSYFLSLCVQIKTMMMA